MASIARAARDAVSQATEDISGLATDVGQTVQHLGQAAGLSSSEANTTPPGKGLGTSVEERQPRKLTSIKALAQGAHRRGDRGGLGSAKFALTYAILHAIGLLFFFGGTIVALQGEALPISFSFRAAVGLWTVAFACWFSRSIVRMMHSHRAREKVDLSGGYADRAGELGSLLFGLRTGSHVLEIVATACLLVGCVAWFFQDKVSGIMGYLLWYLGSVLWVVQHFVESRLVIPVLSTSYLLAGHSQRARAFADWTSNTAFFLASPLVVAGAIDMLVGYYKPALLLWLTAAIFLVGPAVGDTSSAMITRRLQYTEAAPITAAQAALDLYEPPSSSILGEVLDKLLTVPAEAINPTEEYYEGSGSMSEGPIQLAKRVERDIKDVRRRL